MVNARLKCVTIQLWVWMRQKEFQEFARKSGLTIHSCLPMQILVFWKPSWHTQYHTYSHIFLSATQIHTCMRITWRYAEVGSPPSQQLTSLPQLQGQADPAASSVGIWPGSGVVSKSWDFFGSWFNDLCIWFCNRSADPTVWMLSGCGNVLLFFCQLLVAN